MNQLRQRRKSKSFSIEASATNPSNSNAVVQGAIIISKLNAFQSRIKDDSDSHEMHDELQTIIDEVLKLVNMKADNANTDIADRMTKLHVMSEHPEDNPVAGYLLRDFFAQNPNNSAVPESPDLHSNHSSSNKIASLQKQQSSAIVVIEANLSIRKCMKDEITQYFSKNCHEWDFDIFEFDEICRRNGTSTFMALTIHILLPFSQRLDFNQNKLISYFNEIEQGYKSPLSVIYHNSLHAADVLFNIWYFLMSGYFTKNIQVSQLDIFSGLMAALVHDVGHPGTNNAYQIDTCSELALLYNDASVLENYHVSFAFKTLAKPKNDFLADVDGKISKEIRKIVIQSVLGTDMTKHSQQINTLQSHIKHITEEGNQEKRLDVAIKDDMIAVALHVADISNPAKTFDIAKEWADRISEEFFRQGDLQKSQNMDVLPLFDREKTKISQSQIGFIDYVVQPLFKIWGSIITELKETVDVMNESKAKWAQHT